MESYIPYYHSDNDRQKDVWWFKNYEKRSNGKQSPRNKDVLNYKEIKKIEQNYRLSSCDEEDRAGVRSSKCGVKFLGDGRVKHLSKRIEGRRSRGKTSKWDKDVVSLENKMKRPSVRVNTMDVCIYCRSSRKSHFCSNSERNSIVGENSRKGFDVSAEYTYRYPKSLSERNFCKYREYRREDHKPWLTGTTEMTNFENVKNQSRSRGIFPDSRIDRSSINEGKPAKVHAFKLPLRGRKFDGSTERTCGNQIHSNRASNEEPQRDLRYRICAQTRCMRMGKLKVDEESDENDLVNQRPLNKCYPARNAVAKLAARSYHALSKRKEYEERYTSVGCRYPYRSQKSDRISGERKSLCRRKPDFLRKSGKLCRAVRTRENKQWLGQTCRCENAKQDEDCFKYRYLKQENVDNLAQRNYKRQRESTCRPIEMSNETDYTERENVICETLSKSLRSENNNNNNNNNNKYTVASDLSTRYIKRNSQNRNMTYDNSIFDRSNFYDNDRTNNNNDEIKVEDLEPRVSLLSLLDDWTYRTYRSSKVAREYKSLNNDLRSSQRIATKAPSRRRTLREKIFARRYPSDKELYFEIRTPRKLVSEDSSRLGYNTVESTCEYKEFFHDSPAACQTQDCRSCICISKSDENVAKDGTDLSYRMSACYCCTSASLHDGKDAVKKLESFCEKVKAINKDTFHKPSKSNCRKPMRIDLWQYPDDDQSNEQSDRSEISIQMTTTRTSKPIERERLADSIRLRLKKPKCRRGRTNLDRILIYPSREEGGTSLILYKKSSTIDCRVKRDIDSGFRYNVTYVQKFQSPTRISLQETNEECDSFVDYG